MIKRMIVITMTVLLVFQAFTPINQFDVVNAEDTQLEQQEEKIIGINIDDNILIQNSTVGESFSPMLPEEIEVVYEYLDEVKSATQLVTWVEQDGKVFTNDNEETYRYDLVFNSHDVMLDENIDMPSIQVIVAKEVEQPDTSNNVLKSRSGSNISLAYHIDNPLENATTSIFTVTTMKVNNTVTSITAIDMNPVDSHLGANDPSVQSGETTRHEVTLGVDYKIVVTYLTDSGEVSEEFLVTPSLASNYTYEIINSEAVLKTYKTSAPKDMIIPATIVHNDVTYPVTTLQAGLATNYEITTVMFESPSNVTTIGNNAFNGNQLVNVTLPDSILSLGDGAFAYNTLLKTINLPSQITSIPNNLFRGCESLDMHVVIHENITQIGSWAFENAPLTGLTLHHGITEIGSHAFNGSKIPEFNYIENDTTVVKNVLPDSLQVINSHIFYGANLSSIEIGSQFTTIGQSAFSNMPNLTTIILNEGVETIYGSAFSSSSPTENTTVYLPTTLKTIENSVFNNSKIHTVAPVQQYIDGITPDAAVAKLPNNLETIKYFAFNGNTFTNIEIGDAQGLSQIKSIDDNSFSPAYGVKHTSFRIYRSSSINTDNPNTIALEYAPWNSSADFITYDDTSPLIEVDNDSDGIKETYILYKDSATIAKYVGDDLLVTIPSIIDNVEIKNIGASSFVGVNLETITIPKSVSIIDDNAFGGITSITSVIFETDENGNSSLTEIKDSAFIKTHITQLYIPKSVTRIHDTAFYQLYYLEEVVIDSQTSLTIDSKAFGAVGSNQLPTQKIIINHAESIENLDISESAFGGSYIDFISIPNYEKPDSDLGLHQPWGASNATMVLWKDSKIVDVDGDGNDDYVFSTKTNSIQNYLGNSTNLVIPDMIMVDNNDGTTSSYPVEHIANGVFKNNDTLETIVLPEMLQTIGDEAFTECDNLTTVVFNDILNTVGASAFSNTPKLQYSSLPDASGEQNGVFTIPSSLSTYGRYAFMSTGIRELVYPAPNSGMDLFTNSTELVKATAISGTTIAANSFLNCEKLEEFTFPTDATSISSGAFKGTGFKEVIIPEGITGILSSAYEDTHNLETIIFPTTYTNFFYSIFGKSYDDTEATIEQIVIGGSVTSVSATALSGKKIEDIYVMQSKNSSSWHQYLGWGSVIDSPTDNVHFLGEMVTFNHVINEAYDSQVYSRTVAINAYINVPDVKITSVTPPKVDIQPSTFDEIIDVNDTLWQNDTADNNFHYTFTVPGLYFFNGLDSNGGLISYPVVIEEIGKPTFTKDSEGNHLTSTEITIPTYKLDGLTVEELISMINPQASTIEFPTTEKYNASPMYNNTEHYMLSDDDVEDIKALQGGEVTYVTLTTTSGTGLSDTVVVAVNAIEIPAPTISAEITIPEQTKEEFTSVQKYDPVELFALASAKDATSSDLIYQWYYLDGTNEVLIPGATQATYNPSTDNLGSVLYLAKVTDVRTKLTSTSNTLLVAVTPFEITFDATDGIFDDVQQKQIQMYTNNEDIIDGTIVKPLALEKVLLGWQLEDGTIISVTAIQDYEFTSNHTLLAVWADDLLIDKDIDMDENQPGDGIADIYQTIVYHTVVNGRWDESSELTISEVVTFVKDEKPSNEADATALFTKPTSTGNVGYDEGSWTTVEPNETLNYTESKVTYTYEYVANNYQVAFHGNGSVGTAMPNQALVYDRSDVLTKNTYTKEQAVFMGWSLTQEGTTVDYQDKATVSNLTTENNDVVNLYAVWEEDKNNDGIADIYQVTVHYTVVNGTFEDGVEVVEWITFYDENGMLSISDDAIAKLPTTPTSYGNIGYSNGSWDTTIPMQVKKSEVSSEIRYKYTYVPNTYIISYNGNFGEGSMPNQVLTYDEINTLLSNQFVRNGYQFMGWSLSSTGPVEYAEGESVSNLTTVNNQEISLYAYWQQDVEVVLPDEFESTPIVQEETQNGEITEQAPQETSPELEDNVVENNVVEDSDVQVETPAFGNEQGIGSWSLVNLLLTLLTAVICLVLQVKYFTTKNAEKTKQTMILNITSILLAVLLVVIFILTQNISLPMVLFDNWTVLMALITCIQIVIAIMHRKKDQGENNNHVNA